MVRVRRMGQLQLFWNPVLDADTLNVLEIRHILRHHHHVLSDGSATDKIVLSAQYIGTDTSIK